jgi:hypothetical protein
MIRQCYVAGSYSADTRTRELQNVMKALVAAVTLTRRGFHCIVPHVSGSHRVTWEDAMDRCRAIIHAMDPARDCLVLLPGWESSKGAQEERLIALAIGMEVWDLADLTGEQVVHA